MDFIDNGEIMVFAAEYEAEAFAAVLAAGELDGWTYTAKKVAEGFVVMVRDEADEFVAFWREVD